MTVVCNGGSQSFYYLRVGEKQVFFLHPWEVKLLFLPIKGSWTAGAAEEQGLDLHSQRVKTQTGT